MCALVEDEGSWGRGCLSVVVAGCRLSNRNEQTLGIQGRHDTDDSETRDQHPTLSDDFPHALSTIIKSSKTVQIIQSRNYLREKSWYVL